MTTPPEIKIDVNNGIDRWVFVGTGKLYDDTDLASTQLETFYAIRDGTASAPWALPATPVNRATAGMLSLPALDSTNEFGLPNVPDKGWYHDLPAGSRIVVPPAGSVRHHRLYRDQAADRSMPDRLAGDDLCTTVRDRPVGAHGK